jgi:Raf kinase inhibitor-like YbhB/YbcL family protein
MRARRFHAQAAAVLAIAAFAGCSRGEEVAMSSPATVSGQTSLALSSPAFAANGTLPVQYTCDGDEVSPPLRWSGVPAGTNSLALVVDDPDAPRGTWVHWVLYDLPPSADGLPEGASAQPPSGARDGLNDWRRPGYGGACPPSGRHRYVHTLYALDMVLPDLGSPDKAQLVKAMQGHILAQSQLVATYARQH